MPPKLLDADAYVRARVTKKRGWTMVVSTFVFGLVGLFHVAGVDYTTVWFKVAFVLLALDGLSFLASVWYLSGALLDLQDHQQALEGRQNGTIRR